MAIRRGRNHQIVCIITVRILRHFKIRGGFEADSTRARIDIKQPCIITRQAVSHRIPVRIGCRRLISHGLVFIDRNCRRGCKHRQIIRAVNGDRNDLINIATEFVCHSRSIGLANTVAFIQLLGCCKGVIQRVGPLTCILINRNRTIGRRWRPLDAPRQARRLVNITHCQRTTHRCHTRDIRTVMTRFGHHTRGSSRTRRDHRRVIRACECQCDGFAGRVSIETFEHHGESRSGNLTFRKEIERCTRRLIRPKKRTIPLTGLRVRKCTLSDRLLLCIRQN